MSEPHKHYLKMAFTRVQIGKHVSFSNVKSKTSNFNFVIDAQIILNPANPEKQSHHLQTIQIKETDRSEDYVFSQLSLKWDCVRIEEKYLGLKPQLKLNFSIEKANKGFKTSSKDFIKHLIQKSVEKQNEQVEFPIDLSSYSVSLEQFLKEPYKLHVINLDFKIPKKSKLNPRESGERDGMITFELSFLQDLRTELEIRNIKFKTKDFSKFYKVGMFQVLTDRSKFKHNKIKDAQKSITHKDYIQTSHSKQTIKGIYHQKQIETGYCEFILEAHGWQQFRNTQSYSQPHVFPLQLLNEEDELAVLFQYEAVSENIALGMFQIFVKKGLHNAEKNFANNFIPTTSLSLIKIDDLFKVINGPDQWKTFKINVQNGSLNFDLEFQFFVKIGKGQYQNNSPQSLCKPLRKQHNQKAQKTEQFNSKMMLQPKDQENNLKDFQMLDGDKDEDKNESTNFLDVGSMLFGLGKM